MNKMSFNLFHEKMLSSVRKQILDLATFSYKIHCILLGFIRYRFYLLDLVGIDR